MSATATAESRAELASRLRAEKQRIAEVKQRDEQRSNDEAAAAFDAGRTIGFQWAEQARYRDIQQCVRLHSEDYARSFVLPTIEDVFKLFSFLRTEIPPFVVEAFLDMPRRGDTLRGFLSGVNDLWQLVRDDVDGEAAA